MPSYKNLTGEVRWIVVLIPDDGWFQLEIVMYTASGCVSANRNIPSEISVRNYVVHYLSNKGDI